MKVFVLLFSLIFSVSSLMSQEEEVDVRISIICLTGRLGTINYVSDGKVMSVSVGRDIRSKRFPYVGPPTIRFFREANADTTGTLSGEKTLGEVVIPGKTGDFLLIFAKSNSRDEGFQIKAIPDGFGTLEPGMFRFLNLTQYDIALKLGDSRSLLKKGQYTDVSHNSREDMYLGALMYSMVNEEEPFRAFKGSLHYSDQKRVVYVITGKTGGVEGRINLLPITERMNGER